MKPRIYSPTETDFSTNGLGILKDCTRCEIYEVANGKYELELDYPLGTRFDEYFENDYQIKAKPNDQEEYHIFFIDDKDIDTFLNTVTIYAQSRTNRLGRRVVTLVEVDSKTGQEAISIIETKMDKKSDIRLYSDITAVSSTIFEARNVLNCIAGEQGSLLQYWGGEIKREPFKLSLLKRRGRNNVGTIRYGKDMSGLKVKLDWTGIKTRIIPYADPQSEVGTTNRIYGSPVDSAYINNYPDVYTEYVQFTEEQGVKDIKSLNKIAKNYFKTINPGCDKPKVSITVEFDKLTDSEEAKEFAKIRNYGLFDTFKIYHKKYNIYLESKVSGLQYDSLSEKTLKLEAGDIQVAFYQQQAVTIQDKLKDYATNNYMSDFNDYVSSMITGQGSAGGYVVLWPKEKPSNIFIMDNPDLEKAREVLRMNKNGIAFSKKGWRGPFNSAWTLDSIFNANFIQTGLIKADIFQNSFNKTGDVLKLVNGLLQIWNNKKKIMELTKKGMEFWNSKGSIGTIGTTDSAGNPFPNAVTPTPLEENSLVIRTNGDGKYILISPTAEKGFVLLGNGKAYYFGDLDIQGKLTVRGKEVIPGQNGGPSGGGETPGGYPSELKTDAEKRAWRIYDILCNNGFTKQSACGILGNIQQETGGTFDPDTVQIGGPAYGLVQWDGSSYPLVGPATWDGKVYVQNLFNAAGIKEPITSLDAQVRLLIWTFTNGQWMGVVQPTTVDGFKACTDPRQAAYAFERNYERPAATHPERQDYAVNWYNKFKDLKPGGATGEAGLKHLESLIGQRIGNGQCYGLSAEYSGYLGGCGMGAGTKYGLTHVIGNTSAASDIGIAYDWSAVGWKVIQNPRYDQLVVGAIINWARGGQVGSWFADGTYGHTGVIRGLANGRMQTYEQNTELGMICGKLDRQYYSASAISSIVIPPK
ncbi:TPA: phage tail spike protein [Enterococcus faecium]|uniref:phage tail spike protein n=2 Tax=Enterococcus faecium TaxID=1352 RepID=UPI00145A438A|nr:phage tail spike protein [Enterococcus faecium]QMX43041.1 phage tail protein [Enterococcus faecium]HCR2905418.1 phage tail protein [Enterococcus faecium]HDT7924158.1 phage tail protein [Enterococcus faecium]